MLKPEKYANGGQVLVKSALKSATHDCNCKNCGGTRTMYSCDYCGTEYAQKSKPIVVVKLTLWQRFNKWFSSLFKKEEKKIAKFGDGLTNAQKTLIIVASVAMVGVVGHKIYRKYKKR